MKDYNVRFGTLHIEFRRLRKLRGMLLIKEIIASSSKTCAHVTFNCYRRELKLCMCFVTLGVVTVTRTIANVMLVWFFHVLKL
jgi:hypothetical protein